MFALSFKRGEIAGFLSAVCLYLAVGCLGVLAQQDAGGLVVSVRDPKGATVPGAKVVVTNIDTNQTMQGVTIDIGDYTASPLRPGRYKATVDRKSTRLNSSHRCISYA